MIPCANCMLWFYFYTINLGQTFLQYNKNKLKTNLRSFLFFIQGIDNRYLSVCLILLHISLFYLKQKYTSKRKLYCACGYRQVKGEDQISHRNACLTGDVSTCSRKRLSFGVDEPLNFFLFLVN